MPAKQRPQRCPPRRSRTVTVVDFLHTLGHAEGFWVGMAAVQAALIIALVVEGGTVREAWHAAEERLDVDLDEGTTQAEAA